MIVGDEFMRIHDNHAHLEEDRCTQREDLHGEPLIQFPTASDQVVGLYFFRKLLYLLTWSIINIKTNRLRQIGFPKLCTVEPLMKDTPKEYEPLNKGTI